MGNSVEKMGNSYSLNKYSKVPTLADYSDEEDVFIGHEEKNRKPKLQSWKRIFLHKPKPLQKILEPDRKNWMVIYWVSFILITCVLFAVIETFRLAKDNISEVKTNRAFRALPGKGKDWEKKMNNYETESCVRLLDVDGDGILDIVLGLSPSESVHHTRVKAMQNRTLQQVCEEKNMSYPCLGNLFALRGIDGEIIWKANTRVSTIFLNCEDFDVNLDGQKDCIVSGRRATIQAVDTKTGQNLWLGDEKFLQPVWNVYQALALPDFDKDGVPEVLVPHGGDPRKKAKDHNRKSGRLMIFSGATGKVMGSRYLAIPNDKEIYMSPVIHTTKDGSQYIMFGSGGETIPGNFYIISVPDFYRYVMEASDDTEVPSIKGEYRDWPKFVKDKDTGLMTILRGETKGFMVPPVIVDVNHDGTEDFVVSSYSGAVFLLDGRDLSTIWTAEFPYMESYSSPAPGYFNDDDVLDFMVHWSLGEWPDYNNTQSVILDGRDGSKLFVMNSTQYQMSSVLTLHTTQGQRDLFITKVRGRGSQIGGESEYGIMGLSRTQQGSSSKKIIHTQIGANHGPFGNSESYNNEEDGTLEEQGKKPILDNKTLSEKFRNYSMTHYLCTDDLDVSSEILLFDRTSARNPIQISTTTTEKFHYRVPDVRNETMVDMCVVITPDDSTTAAIGDVDGDGVLDIVSLVPLSGKKVNSDYSTSEELFFAYVKKVSLGPALKDDNKKVSANVWLSFTPNHEEKNLSDLGILPRKQQTWTEYMGTKGNSHY